MISQTDLTVRNIVKVYVGRTKPWIKKHIYWQNIKGSLVQLTMYLVLI